MPTYLELRNTPIENRKKITCPALRLLASSDANEKEEEEAEGIANGASASGTGAMDETANGGADSTDMLFVGESWYTWIPLLNLVSSSSCSSHSL